MERGTVERIWRDARSIDDLGHAMACWLEGHTGSRPGYFGTRPDEETRHLIPVLGRANRSGFVTTDSQPGRTSTAFDGRPWVQRAAVQGYVAAANPLLTRITGAARAAGLVVTVYGPGHAVGPRDGLVATRWADCPHTAFGGRSSRAQRRTELHGIGRSARRDLDRHGVALAVIDPAWGRDDVLWSLIDRLC